ncbi:hypothetical protein EDC01DRAFT_330846 [Geopyxis carbonaria]|nr:hypothetical protein EDC01DRAFT_330846 [Geopyxis carbonaria]
MQTIFNPSSLRPSLCPVATAQRFCSNNEPSSKLEITSTTKPMIPRSRDRWNFVASRRQKNHERSKPPILKESAAETAAEDVPHPLSDLRILMGPTPPPIELWFGWRPQINTGVVSDDPPWFPEPRIKHATDLTPLCRVLPLCSPTSQFCPFEDPLDYIPAVATVSILCALFTYLHWNWSPISAWNHEFPLPPDPAIWKNKNTDVPHCSDCPSLGLMN